MGAPADDVYSNVQLALLPSGLLVLGWCVIEDGRSALLIGNIGSSIWPSFSRSPEYEDSLPDPMNRWTVATVQPVAELLNAEVRYPFGAPVWPFQQYAMSATGMKQSPLGLLIHPEFGPWTAFRALLVFDQTMEFTPVEPTSHPCDFCMKKPCLNTCPVGAFSTVGYDYSLCHAHMASQAGQQCRLQGCLARQACPVGPDYEYDPKHQAFHMSAAIVSYDSWFERWGANSNENQ